MEMVTRRIERIAVILLTLALLITSGPAMSMVTLTASAVDNNSAAIAENDSSGAYDNVDDEENTKDDIAVSQQNDSEKQYENASETSKTDEASDLTSSEDKEDEDNLNNKENKDDTPIVENPKAILGAPLRSANDPSNVETWEELVSAIESAGSGDTITITADLVAESQIEINKNITIVGTSGKKIYRDPDNADFAVFKVKSGILKLGDNLTMTGETLICSGSESNTFTLSSSDGQYLTFSEGVMVRTNNASLAAQFSIDSEGYLTSGGEKVGKYGVAYGKPSSTPFKVCNVSGTEVTSFISPCILKVDNKFISVNSEDPAAFNLEDEYSYGTYWTAINSSSGSGGQDCDAKCGTWDNTQFSSGTTDAYKGFFVEVEGGKAVLNGATLEHFNTSREKDKTPRFVAPVAVKGSGSSFDVLSGAIKNNTVGYIVEDDKANESADSIKAYVKGAAPNAQRTEKGEAVRRNAVAGIDDGEPGSGITGTAGAIIYSNGATGEITGGDIGFNRGDTGGVFVTGSNTKVDLKDGTNINNNVGVQFGGGTTVEDGGFIAMTGGTIQKNVAWFGGGAVYATENGIKWLLCEQNELSSRKDGWFTMDGGKLDSNTAFTRGGAILADSDGVTLLKGKMTNNMSRMLGGAVYVMGDHADFSYTVYIEKGYVHGNKAVSAGYKTTDPYNPQSSISGGYKGAENQLLSRKLAAPTGCEDSLTDLFYGEINSNTDDLKDGYPNNHSLSTDGTGGGVWLCAYGNTTLDLSSNSEFYIDNNYANGSFRGGPSSQNNKKRDPSSSPKAGGNDIHKETRSGGNIVITGVDNTANWYDENTGDKYTSSDNVDENGTITDFGLRNLVNSGNNRPEGYDSDTYEGVDVYGNISRRGGGLAADGTFVFGKFQDVAELMAEMTIRKSWASGLTENPIVLKVFVEEGDKKVEINRLLLSGTAKEISELDTTFDDGIVDGKYQGRLTLPITVDDENGNTIQVFDIQVNGSKIDLTDIDALTTLAQTIDSNPEAVKLDSSGRKITFEEYVQIDPDKVDGGLADDNLKKTDEFELSPESISLGDLDSTIHNIPQKETNGDYRYVLNVSFSEIGLNADLVNDHNSEIEKYVNQAVHKDIAVDEIFEYDVLAYVKHGSDKLIIEDTLVDDLEFVSNDNVKVTVLDENNHKPFNDINDNPIDGNSDASVHVEGTTISTDKRSVNKTNNKLTVTIANKLNEVKDGDTVIGYENADDEQNLTPYWGKWVKVSFKAQIKESLQNRIKAGEKPEDVLKYAEIKAGEKYQPEGSIYDEDGRPKPNLGNNPVKSNEDHKGVENTASYKLEVKNEGKWKDESNTVTVKPQQPEVEKYVNQAVHKNIALDEVFTYDIIGFISTDADKVEFEDKLVDCLELVNISDIEVVSLESNNHKPTNNISGEKINDDASVAEDGTSIKNADGVTLMAEDEGDILSVVIDDKVTVNEEGTVIDRTYNTVKGLRGKYVKITFQAQIKKEIQNKIKSGEMTLEELLSNQSYAASIEADGNTPVDSDEAHDGIKNNAAMKITVGNVSKYDLETNTVTVKPELPEIEKYVNEAVHDYIDLNEEFTYDIIAYVTKDADTVLIKDTLDNQLEFAGDKSDVKVVDLGKSNNHKPVNNIYSVKINDDATVAEKGSKIDNAIVNIEDNMLSVSIPDASSLRGNWVKVTFKAKIKAGLGIEDLKYTEIKDADEEKRDAPNIGNDPVISDEDHKGVPNKASYEIGVKNSAGTVDKKYEDESNTVTVKPDEIPVYFSKKELDGEELEGATIVVKDEEGNVIEEWVSTTESHRIDLKPGKYSMQEVVAPDGFQRVTTTIWFEVNEDGKVTLLTAEVDNGGKISIMDADHIILEDAPVKNPLLTIKKTSKTKNAMPGDVIDYVITIENSGDGDAEAVEVEDTMDDNLTYVSDDSDGVNDGQKVTWTVDVAAGKTKTIKIKCRVDDDASGKVINKAEITNYETEFVDNGDDEHDVVLGKSKNKDSGSNSKSKTRGARTGDETQIVLWSITLLLTLALVVVLRIRRRYQR